MWASRMGGGVVPMGEGGGECWSYAVGRGLKKRRAIFIKRRNQAACQGKKASEGKKGEGDPSHRPHKAITLGRRGRNFEQEAGGG